MSCSVLLAIFVTSYYLISQFYHNVPDGPVSVPKLENKIYKSVENGTIEFMDVNGLNEFVEFEVELLGSGFAFLEGPKWIATSSTTGYVLFTELWTHTIWKYDEQHKENPFESVAIFDQLECGPTGIAWNKNFGNELWIACWLSGDILKLDATTYKIQRRYDFQDFKQNEGIKFMIDDIIMDSKGNVCFTDMPIPPMGNCGPYHRGGTFIISRDNLDEIQLIELLDFVPNGIALRKDELLFTVSNMIDVPLNRESIFGKTDFDHSKIYIGGYSIENPEQIIPFMYFDPNDDRFHDYFSYNNTFNYMIDSSGFDASGNMWQAVFLNDVENNESQGGQASIFTNNINGTNPKYIGTIRVYDTELQFSNFDLGADGYMYATGGDFIEQKGSLSRIKLKKSQLEQKHEL